VRGASKGCRDHSAGERNSVVSKEENDPTPMGDGSGATGTPDPLPDSVPLTSIHGGEVRPAPEINPFAGVTRGDAGRTSPSDRATERIDPKPLIEAMEALSSGIRKELELARESVAGGSLPQHGTGLTPLVEAAQAEIRRLREELGLENAGGPLGVPSLKSSDGVQQEPDDDHLAPLIDVFQEQLRGIRRDLSGPDADVEQPLSLPPMGTSTFLDSPPEASATKSVPAADTRDGRSRRGWLFAFAAAFIGMAAIGAWFTSGEREEAPAAGGTVAAPQSAAAERSTPAVPPASTDTRSTDTRPAANLPAVPPVEAARTDSLGTTGSDDHRQAPGTLPRTGARELGARSRVAPPEPVVIAPRAPAAAGVSAAEASPSSAISGSLTPEVNPAGAPEKPSAGSPAGTAIASRDPAGPELNLRTSANAAATTPERAASAAPVTRPVTVLTRVQPRRLVDVLSGEMSAVVEVEVSVNSEGRPYEVRAISGPAALRAPAEDNVRRWTFSPALEAGKPIGGDLTVTVTFGPWVRDMRFRRRSP
jgi:hypothetical protein